MASGNLSEIQQFFHGSTIFLTGATGFLGKHILEKLLRSCPGIRHIYILIRVKKNTDPKTRFMEIFQCPIYDPLKRSYPNFVQKVTLINGDCAEPNLGLGDQDISIIHNEVDVIIHCAATVRFDQKLSQATKINVRATRDLLQIAHQVKNLKAFVHVSTAYSNCDRTDIDETYYPPKIDGDKLITAIDCLGDENLLDIQPRLLGKLPNTYTLTKQVAEEIVRKYGQDLPIVIVRPSIILATADEPIQGFIDNFYGPTAIFLAGFLGISRTVLADNNLKEDWVPVDYVTNCILAATKYIGTTRMDGTKCDPKIFNFVSSNDNPITAERAVATAYKHGWDYGSTHVVWRPLVFCTSNVYLYRLLLLLFHTIPAYIGDGVRLCLGKKPKLVKLYSKLANINDILKYFLLTEWQFSNENTTQLYKELSQKDKKLFNFDIKCVNWEDYFIMYIKGVRLYIVKDPMETLEEGRKHMKKLDLMHNTLCAFLILLLVLVLNFFFSFLF